MARYTTTSVLFLVFTELAIKYCSCAWWCIFSSCAIVGCL